MIHKNASEERCIYERERMKRGMEGKRERQKERTETTKRN
jgi:hypothetical protein